MENGPKGTEIVPSNTTTVKEGEWTILSKDIADKMGGPFDSDALGGFVHGNSSVEI